MQALWDGTQAPQGGQLRACGSYICYESLKWADILEQFPPGSKKATEETLFLWYNGINHYEPLFLTPASVGSTKPTAQSDTSSEGEPLSVLLKKPATTQKTVIDLTTSGRGKGRSKSRGRGRGRGCKQLTNEGAHMAETTGGDRPLAAPNTRKRKTCEAP